MSWATQDDVFKNYRMLTRRQALIRQLSVCILFGSTVTFLYLLLPHLSSALSLISGIVIFYVTMDIIIPSSYFESIYEERLHITKEQSSQTNTSSSDTPVYADNKQMTRKLHFYVKLLMSPKIITFAKLVSSTGSVLFLSTFLSSQPRFIIMIEIFVTNTAAYLVGVITFLTYIERKEIDEFPTNFKDKFLLSFQKKFSHSRGYYFIGEIRGKRIGLPRMLRFMHTLMGGPTGERKTSSLIIPPLLFDADSIGSALVPDAKSPDLFNWVAGRWYKNGKKVFLFDPWHPETIGMNFIPDADDKDILDIIEVLMREREEVIGKEEAFFRSRTRYLLYAIIKLVQSFNDEYCNLSSVFYIVESVDTLKSFIDSSDENLRRLFSDFHKMTSETKVNALTSLREKLEFFLEEDVRKAFSKSEFKLNMLFREKEPCLLVLGAPIDKKEPGTKIASLIVNLVINMAFRERRLQKQASQRGEKSFIPNDLYLYLDELRNLKITALADLVSIARETKTHVIGSVTDIGFFKYYREDYSSLMGNFRTRIFMKGLDYDSCKYISDSLGKDNVVTYKYMRGLMASQEQRNLLDPDKVMNLPEDKIIVFSPKTKPFCVNKISIYDSKWIKKMQYPPPKELRKLYEEWGLTKEPLKDPVLPKVKGHYDMAKIKSGKPVTINETITVEKVHKEMGGGRWVKEGEVREIEIGHVEEEVVVKSDDEDAASTIM